MKTPTNYADKAAVNFLNALQQSDPIAYRIISQHVENSTVNGMGEGEQPSLWESIKSGFVDIAKTGANWYANKELAELQRKRAEEMAKAAIAQQEAELAKIQGEIMTAQAAIELERQKTLLEQAKNNISSVKPEYWLIGAGVVGLFAAYQLSK